MKELKPFVACYRPVHLQSFNGELVVPCGSCPACRRAKADTMSLKLQLEERNHLASFLVTLTYDEENVPRLEWSTEEYEDMRHTPANLRTLPFERVAGTMYAPNEISFEDYIHTVVPSVPFEDLQLTSNSVFVGNGACVVRDADYVVPKRTLVKFHWTTPRLKTENYDTQFDYDTKQLDDFSRSYDGYYHRRRAYETRYSKTSFHQNQNQFDVLYPRDLQLFLHRFRKWCWRKFGATFRYYAVGEYGTDSLRPHWHIIFFFDDPKLISYLLREQKNYGTLKRPSYCSPIFHSLWQYGITNSSRVEKSCASYVAGYVNLTGDLPEFIQQFAAPRSYHSVHIGEILPQENIVCALQKRSFDSLGACYAESSTGSSFTYALWRSCITSYLRGYAYVSPTAYRTNAQVYFALRCICQEIEKVYGVTKRTDIARILQDNVESYFKYGVCDMLPIPCFESILASYLHAAINSDKSTLWYSLVLQTYSIRDKYLPLFGCSPLEYFRIRADYFDYVSRETLRCHFTQCQINGVYEDFYYRYIDNDFSLDDDPLFQVFKRRINIKNERLRKHASVADKYRFN